MCNDTERRFFSLEKVNNAYDIEGETDLDFEASGHDDNPRNVETSLMMSNTPNDGVTKERGAVGGALLETPEMPVADSSPQAAEVSVVSPLRGIQVSEDPSEIMASAQKPKKSIASSRSSRRRLELETVIMEEEAKAEIQRKEQALLLRQKERDIAAHMEARELELEARKEARELEVQKEKMALDDLKRQSELNLKLKQLEIMEKTSSQGSVSSFASFHIMKTKTSDWLDSNKDNFGLPPDSNSKTVNVKEKPCSSAQADCELTANEFEPLSGKQLGAKPKKTLMFDPSKTFTPGQSTKAEPPFTPSLTLPNVSAPGFTIPETSIPMKLPKLVLDKFSGDPLEWPEWSRQFLATVDQAGVADSVKLNYLKTLVNGKAKAAVDGMGYSGAMYQVAWQTLEHDFGRPELIVNAQLRTLHSHSFIKPHDSLEIINSHKWSQDV